MLCKIRLTIRFSYVFDREKYPTYRSLPVDQLENLFCKLSQVLILFADAVHPDIEKIDVPEQNDPFLVRDSQDITTGERFDSSWTVTCKLSCDVEFLVKSEDFTPVSYDRIQPATFGLPEDLEPIDLSDTPFDLKRLDIAINRAQLIDWSTSDPNTYELAAKLTLEEVTLDEES